MLRITRELRILDKGSWRKKPRTGSNHEQVVVWRERRNLSIDFSLSVAFVPVRLRILISSSTWGRCHSCIRRTMSSDSHETRPRRCTSRTRRNRYFRLCVDFATERVGLRCWWCRCFSMRHAERRRSEQCLDPFQWPSNSDWDCWRGEVVVRPLCQGESDALIAGDVHSLWKPFDTLDRSADVQVHHMCCGKTIQWIHESICKRASKYDRCKGERRRERRETDVVLLEHVDN